jgi:hypothetical protein
MLPPVRRAAATVLLLGMLAAPALAANTPPEQTVTPIVPKTEQRVDALGSPDAEQRVQTVDADGTQAVSGGTREGAFRRSANAVAKVAIGIVAAAVAIGSTAAALLLLWRAPRSVRVGVLDDPPDLAVERDGRGGGDPIVHGARQDGVVDERHAVRAPELDA